MRPALDGRAPGRTGRCPDAGEFPTVADMGADRKRDFRLGAGKLFIGPRQHKKLTPMPKNPSIKFLRAALCARQSRAAERDARDEDRMSEEIILACLLRDCVLSLMADHGWWGAQLFEPTFPESRRSRFAITDAALLRRLGRRLRISDQYRIFGKDYAAAASKPPTVAEEPQVVHGPRLVTVNDLYAFDPKPSVIRPFTDIIGRLQVAEGRPRQRQQRARTCGARWRIRISRCATMSSRPCSARAWPWFPPAIQACDTRVCK